MTFLLSTDIFVQVCLRVTIERRPIIPWTNCLFDVQVLKRKWTLFSRIITSAEQISKLLNTERMGDFIGQGLSAGFYRLNLLFRTRRITLIHSAGQFNTTARNLHFPCYCWKFRLNVKKKNLHSDAHNTARKFSYWINEALDSRVDDDLKHIVLNQFFSSHKLFPSGKSDISFHHSKNDCEKKSFYPIPFNWRPQEIERVR